MNQGLTGEGGRMTSPTTVPHDAVAFAKRLLDGPMMALDAGAGRPTKDVLVAMGLALEQAAANPDTNDFDVLVGIAADLLRKGEGMPVWLATFAADVLEGKRKRPTKRGADRYSTWERDFKLWRVTQEVATAFSLPAYTNNELSKKAMAAQVVSLAAGCSVDMVILACRRFGPRRG